MMLTFRQACRLMGAKVRKRADRRKGSVMRLKLLRSSAHRPFDVPANGGIDEVEPLLLALRERGVPVEILDTAAMPDAERERTYFEEAVPVAVWHHVGIRATFGTNRASGTAFFGREVPALLAYRDDGTHATDVFPHAKAGTTVTIRDYLIGL